MYLFDSKKCEIINRITLEVFELDKRGAELLEKYLNQRRGILSKQEEENLRDGLSEVDINLEDIISWEKSFFAPQIPIVHIIKNCNSACVMCDCWKNKKLEYHSKEELKKVFKSLSERGAISIMVSGGEPILHPELEGIIDIIHHNNMKVQLNTNGILLRNKDFLFTKNIEALVVSMDGFNKKDYKSVRGVDKFETVCENIKYFKEKSPNTVVGLRVTLTKYFFANIDILLELCLNLGIDHVGFSPLDVTTESFSRIMNNEKSKALVNDLLPDIKFIENTLKDLRNCQSEIFILINNAYQDNIFSWPVETFIKCLEYYKRIILEREFEDDNEPCKFPYFSLLVDYDGSVKSCFYSNAYSTIDKFETEIWDVRKISNDLIKSGKCIGCRGKIFCG